ncbi:hypothetical protein CB0940_11979 [Cercospora beticola]|uniref:Uncharacterized protein n=1 Tax=Cercospora beticola TaxID=122368 RepID=A0A2G5IE29_CERBT|nr:hypothetical protein CB0940_11979 [Cercospora beticola]PIB03061.1 hypothetical protein CB0940_11979 [Cercospora beticola]WPB04357.1 hypothetical protein RHO25_009003 [Cercospora beticola]
MLFSNSVCALVAALSAQALANKDSTTCYTEMTYKSPGRQPVTSWVTHKTPCTIKQTHTETKTKTPTYTKVETKYITTYVTDRNKYTSTKYVTETKDTKTVTDTKTDTSTATTTTSVTSTSTVPARADFTAVQESVPGATIDGEVGGPPAPAAKRSSDDLEERSDYGGCKKSYPKKVTCHKYTKDGKCATKKVTTTKTIHAKTKTVHAKTTKTKTETKCPEAKKTITSTVYDAKTTTITTTASTTTTSTATSVIASTTVYGECLSPSNYANYIDGNPIVQNRAERPGLAFEEALEIEDAFSCCNAAFSPRAASEGALLESVELWVFGDVSVDGDVVSDTTRCLLFGSSNMCSARQEDAPWFLDTGIGAPPPSAVLGNARCGQGVFGEALTAPEEGEGGTLRTSSARTGRLNAIL